MQITQFPQNQGSPQWMRQVEQVIQKQQQEIWRLWNLIQQLRTQVGNLPINPDVTLP